MRYNKVSEVILYIKKIWLHLTMKNDYYVYVLMDSSKKGNYKYKNIKLDYEPFYIGKGKNDRINQTLYDSSPFKRNKISKLNENNIKILSKKLYENIMV